MLQGCWNLIMFSVADTRHYYIESYVSLSLCFGLNIMEMDEEWR
jgi:hypothetical protein